MFVIKRARIRYMMRSLQVCTKNKLTTLSQGLLHVQSKGITEFIFMIQHSKVVFARHFFFTPKGTGSEYAGDRNLIKTSLNKPALPIRLLICKAVHNSFRKMTGINAHTTIFIVLAINKIGFIPFRDEVQILNLIGTHAVILNADNISILFGQPSKKTLINSLGQAIDAEIGRASC